MTVTPQIKAIETRYAGCRFRSRLEARWAVFFDTLGITWEYEQQGYVVDGRPYLPDFWLPDLSIWAEVKGVLERDELELLVAAAKADGLPHGHTGRPLGTSKVVPCLKRLLVLGPISDPKPGWTPNHTLLYLVGTEVVSFHSFFAQHERWDIIPFSEPCPAGFMAKGPDDAIFAEYRRDLLNPRPIRLLAPIPGVNEALWAARSARFEHGDQS